MELTLTPPLSLQVSRPQPPYVVLDRPSDSTFIITYHPITTSLVDNLQIFSHMHSSLQHPGLRFEDEVNCITTLPPLVNSFNSSLIFNMTCLKISIFTSQLSKVEVQNIDKLYKFIQIIVHI